MVVKQGAAVALYMLPNMFAVMGLMVLAVFLGTKMDPRLSAVGMILIASVLALLCYRRVMILARKQTSPNGKK